MALDHAGLVAELDILRALALKKLADDPLPAGIEAERRIRAEIAQLGLERNITELETKGYTALAPEDAAPAGFWERLRDVILRIADDESSQLKVAPGTGRNLFHMVPRDRVFEEVLLQPRPLALLTYLLGYRAKLSQSTVLIKERTETQPLFFHADHSRKVPEPWPNPPVYCNVSWVLSDYTRDAGPLCVFPGSHKRGHDVPANLRMAHDSEEVEVIEVPAGTVLVWHGSLWHGALPRSAEGQRITLVMPFCRYHVQPQEMYWATTTDEMIERNPARFASLMGLAAAWPWTMDGPDTSLLAAGPSSNSPFE
jgi:hypothetical protein